MKEWLAHTLKNIPEVADDLDPTEDEYVSEPMYIWLQLRMLFEKAALEKDEDLIRRIFDEKDYYFDNATPPDDFSTAVALAFVEHWLDQEENIPYILKYIPKSDYVGYKELLTYHNSYGKYEKVLKMYDKK